MRGWQIVSLGGREQILSILDLQATQGFGGCGNHRTQGWIHAGVRSSLTDIGLHVALWPAGPVWSALILLRVDIHCHPKWTRNRVCEQGSSSSSPPHHSILQSPRQRWILIMTSLRPFFLSSTVTSNVGKSVSQGTTWRVKLHHFLGPRIF
jgi:hypothetical protein